MKSAIEQLADDSNVDAAFRQIIAGETGNYIAWCADQDAATITSLRAKLSTIIRAYDSVLKFENTTIPTALMCAIEAARKV